MIRNRDEIYSLLASLNEVMRQLGVKRIGVFGSFEREENNDFSDIDLVVDFVEGKKTYSAFYALAELLEKQMGRKVDLLTTESISPYFREEIEKDITYHEVAA